MERVSKDVVARRGGWADLLAPLSMDAFQAKLFEIHRSPGFLDGRLEELLPRLTELGSAALSVARCCVLQLSIDGGELECMEDYNRSEGRHGRGAALSRSRYPQLFAALGSLRALSLHDTRSHALGAGLYEGYFSLNDVGACHFSPAFVRGRLVGALTFEHEGGSRIFTAEEQLAAASLADVLAAALGTRELLRLENELLSTQGQLSDVIERRTSSFVRENADLQREVDELTLSAEQIKRSEDDLRLLFAAAPVPMLLVRRRDYRVLMANEKCLMALGVSANELKDGLARALFAHRSDYADVRKCLERSGSVESQEVQLRDAHGQPFWALMSARAVVFEGAATVMVGFIDLTNQKAVEHQLRFLAQRDPLTQAYNRHHFWQLAAVEMLRVNRYERPLSLAMVDADHFKAINDAHGHDVGDLVLRQIVDICQDSLRKTDVLARYGGEELVVMLPETEAQSARVVMERIRARVAETALTLEDGSEVRVTVSVGIAGLALDREESLESLLKRSDDALYAAKRSGRNRLVVASDKAPPAIG